MIRVVVDSRVRIDPRDELPDDVAAKLREAFTHRNPKRAQLERAKVRGWWNEPPAIPTWGEGADGVLSFPRGGMSKVRKILQESGVPFAVSDRRLRFEEDPEVPESDVELRPYQHRLVDACLAKENALVVSGTGSGKTTALLSLYSAIKVPTLVLVSKLALVEQWVRRAAKELGVSPKSIGTIGDGKFRLGHLTVGIPKSVSAAIARDPEFVNRWGAVFADEVHEFAARTLFSVVDRFPARYRVGASDDERRKDRLEFLIHDLFGERASEVTDRELIDSGAIMDVEVLLVPTEFEAEWYSATGKGDDKSPDYGRLIKEMADDSDRHSIIERIIASELGDRHQILVFAREREHCRAIGLSAAAMTRAGYLIGGPDMRAEYRRTTAGLESGLIQLAVGTYQACGTGLDLPRVEVGLAASPCLANRTTFRQARGRICRRPEGKTVARFYVLVDTKVFGIRHVENAASWNKTNTFVWEGGSWVQVREWLRARRIMKKD